MRIRCILAERSIVGIDKLCPAHCLAFLHCSISNNFEDPFGLPGRQRLDGTVIAASHNAFWSCLESNEVEMSQGQLKSSQ